VRQQRKARLLIIGEGNERAGLEQLACDLNLGQDVAFPGYLHNPYPQLSRAAVFVLSSAYEGLPNALLEALALRIPVVSTDCESGPREILAGGRYGRLVPVGDRYAMARAIVEDAAGRRP